MQFLKNIYERMPAIVQIVFRGLSYRSYRLYFFGQSISLVGTWVQNIALSWLVFRLTESAFILGTVVFALHIPSLFLSPIAGVMADRWNRRKTIFVTQAISMVISFTLAALTLTGNITVNWILALATINGIILAIDTPFRQAFVPDMVTRSRDVGNAIALNSTLYNLARFIGPPIGGILIGIIGEGWCFFINGFSFLAVLVALVKIRATQQETTTGHPPLVSQLMEGLNHAWNLLPLRYLLRLLFLSSFFGLPFQALLPVFASDVLSGDSQMLGFLTGALGAGALTGALFLASRQNILLIPDLTYRAAVAFSIGLALFSLSSIPALSMAALAIAGFGMIIHFNATNTLLQNMADEDKRGRIVALYSLSFMGITPLGSLAVGWLADSFGVPATVFAFSAICLLSAFLFGKKVPEVVVLLARKTSVRG